ncbi:MAG: ribosomal protein S18-alanine N-acetyltransferase [Microcystis sp. M048S1]|uniref:ribosomal protein S18-alanine N-acetyltransferase n=1 Tax=unclassified Microcystis TaxID=2643300 RepID=UPI001195C5F8|nr:MULTISPECIES: ribosomal protein S18-alanine N-acetyltransferase [unclassified Microcystis]MCA2900783.1 ribosomal protein S18-alanine N-acetyltransferase [Microcystis sp. M035S1]MCA2722982.1 ribosomal protein S18-alanine N-acetyltransferase [Microcystis sp. M176S2]MCA2727945.1 ribosomal protein S18-alanine N-acetyltransferase [Microcystis sp. M166S2]MCA2730476.1 ribosomal protein S18-alanine N-acetyltransferase [Microcystis sp. M162S2]MCA2748120.1 ribosomal protein S18-alanine N-acetyltransf
MAKIQLKTPKSEHLAAMVSLDRTSLGGIWTLSGYQRELDSPNSELLILTLDRDSETLIGLACFWAILEEAHITLLAIYPDYQRQGLGKLLLYKLLEKAVQRQLERATLEVRVSNQSAIALYEHFGFRIAGERKNYYPQTGESALIFWRNDLQTAAFQEQLSKWRQEILSRLVRGEWQLEEETRAKIDTMGMQ